MSRLSTFLVVAPLALSALIILAPGCNRQSEGEPCSTLKPRVGEESDCADGLVCTPTIGLANGNVSVCCPEDGSFTVTGCVPDTGQKTTSTTGGGGAGGTTTSGGGKGGAGGSTTGGGKGGGTGGNGTGGTGGKGTGGTGGAGGK